MCVHVDYGRTTLEHDHCSQQSASFSKGAPIKRAPTDPTANERPGEQQQKTAATAKSGVGNGEPGVRGRLGDNDVASFTTRPNVFFIMIDDMGWNDIGYQSTDLSAVTPNLDSLAAAGIKVRVSTAYSLRHFPPNAERRKFHPLSLHFSTAR